MENGKRIVLNSAGLGGGFALVAAVILGVCIWWGSRPARPKPWNTTAITATYDDVRTEGETNTVAFDYTLQNNTDQDLRISDGTNVQVAAHLRQSNALSFSKQDTITTTYPIYVPAHSRSHFTIGLAYPTPMKGDSDAPDDVRHDAQTKLAQYIVKNLNNIDGLVLMDDITKYQINLPDGWDARAKEALKVKTLDSVK